MSIDFTKPVQTKNGRKVRVLCTDAREPYPVIVLYEDTKEVGVRTSDGRNTRGSESSWDLINVPEEVTVDVWVNVYLQTGTNAKPQIGLTYRTREDAVEARTKSNAVTFHIKRTVPVGHVDE